MALTLDVQIPRRPGLRPVVELAGDDDVSLDLLVHVRPDLELCVDGDEGPSLRLRAPDRCLVLATSSSLPGPAFFALEASLGGGSARPALVARRGRGRPVDLGGDLGWCLLDFSGSSTRAALCAAARDVEGALREARLAVAANVAVEGFRVLLVRHLVAAGRADEARGRLDEELALFPGSWRARFELAALAWRAGDREGARARLFEALGVYPNHLQSLLLLAELSPRGEDGRLLSLLARAWRLAGATSPDLVHALLARRRREDLATAVRAAARTVDLGSPVDLGAAWAGQEDEPSGAGEEKKYEEQEDTAGAAPAVSSCFRDDVVRLAARHVYRDGAVTPEEKLVFRRLCERFPVPAERLSALVAEERRRAGAAPGRGGLDPAALFRDVLVAVYADGRVSAEEADAVLGVAQVLGLSRSECLSVQREVRAGAPAAAGAARRA